MVMLNSDPEQVEKETRVKSQAKKKLGFIKGRRRIVLLLIGVVLVVGALVWWVTIRDDKPKQTANNPIVASYEKQLPALAEAVKQDNGSSKAHYNYAVALYATGDVAKAKEQYELSAKLSKNDATLQNNLGNVYRDLGEYEKAVSAYQKAISIDPKSTNPYINLANLYLYTLEQKDLAIKTYESALESLPDNQDLRLLMGIAYEQSGNKDKAREIFQAILELNASNAAAASGLKRVQ